MSYILDALRKSEKERALANIPTLRSVGQAERKRVPLSWFLFTSALAISIAVLFGVSSWRMSPQSGPVVQREVTEKRAANAIVQTERAAEMQSQGESIVSEEQAVGLSDNTPIPVPITDLDPSTRSRLPQLSINALSYSANQAKRFVMINQDIFKEGEDLGNGIVVEEIKKSTVVLSFAGKYFILQPF